MSLRTRLTISYVSFFALALIVLDIGLYLIVREALFSSIDNELRIGAQSLQGGFERSNQTVFAYFKDNRVTIELRSPQVSDFDLTNLYVQVYGSDGNRATTSSNLPAPMSLEPGLLQKALDGVSNFRTINNQHVRLRELIVPLRLGDSVVGVLQVARSMRDIDQALTFLSYALVGGGVIVLLAAARGGAWLTRAAFKPIDEISRTAQSIVHAEDLSRRVAVPDSQDELHRLSVTINELLERMDGLFSTQQRFLADVSHELRTPLAAMRGNLEVLYRGATRDPQLLNESLDDMRREVNRLIRMVNDLLLLAQSDAGVLLHQEPVELDTLLLEVHRELRPLADGIQLRIGNEDQIIVVGDRDRIKQALLNLGVNALQHTPSGGTVILSLDRVENYARLCVADTGYGIAPEDLPLIFERFYRADRARNRRVGGAGLGLAIVKWIAEAHGGRVMVESVVGSGSTFSLLLPLSIAEVNQTLQFAHHEHVTT